MAFLLELFERLGDRLEIFAADEGHRLNIAEAIAGLARDTELYLCGPMRTPRRGAPGVGRGRTASDVVALRDFRQ